MRPPEPRSGAEGTASKGRWRGGGKQAVEVVGVAFSRAPVHPRQPAYRPAERGSENSEKHAPISRTLGLTLRRSFCEFLLHADSYYRHSAGWPLAPLRRFQRAEPCARGRELCERDLTRSPPPAAQRSAGLADSRVKGLTSKKNRRYSHPGNGPAAAGLTEGSASNGLAAVPRGTALRRAPARCSFSACRPGKATTAVVHP